MTKPTFSIILPTFNNGRLIENAITSILRQTRQDFEVLIVCDGAVEEGVASARAWARKDPRFIVHEHPKGPAHGEIYRDQAIRKASGSLICYIGDDDIWLKDHLATVAEGLGNHDFVYTMRCRATPGGFFTTQNDAFAGPKSQCLDNPAYREKSIEDKNKLFVAQFSATAHTLSSYLALASGWSKREKNLRSYQAMWYKFAADERVRIKFIPTITSVVLPSNLRSIDKKQRHLKTRDEEGKAWLRLMESKFLRDAMNYYSHHARGPTWTLEVLNECSYLDQANGNRIHVGAHLADAAFAYATRFPGVRHSALLIATIYRLRTLGLMPSNQALGVKCAAQPPFESSTADLPAAARSAAAGAQPEEFPDHT